jgi:hypothetical protein
MKELPIESSVDEFVDAIIEATGDRVVCAACGHTTWATYDATPMTLGADNLRPDISDGETLFGIHAVAFACTHCGLLRLHAVQVSFPQNLEEE